MKKGNFRDQIFINCPFDNEYIKIFRAMVFAIMSCGFTARCSLEIKDSSELRLQNIIRLIEYCKYGIHDISHTKLDKRTKLPRFNMPFELGLFYGAKIFGNISHKSKNCLVFELKQFNYRKYISDLSGSDIHFHNKSIKKVINAIRNWLASSSRRKPIPSANNIFKKYINFNRYFRNNIRSQMGINPDKISFLEYMQYKEFTKNITEWLKINKIAPQLLEH